MKVKCPSCCKVYHETTDKYNPDTLPNGSMVRLIEPYHTWKWSAFADGLPAHIGITYSGMRCPACEASMLVKNRLVVIPDKPETKPEFVCEICGKTCKSKLGLGSHMRSHEKEMVNA